MKKKQADMIKNFWHAWQGKAIRSSKKGSCDYCGKAGLCSQRNRNKDGSTFRRKNRWYDRRRMYGKPHPESVSSYAERGNPQSRLVLEDMSGQEAEEEGLVCGGRIRDFSGSTISVYPKIQWSDCGVEILSQSCGHYGINRKIFWYIQMIL